MTRSSVLLAATLLACTSHAQFITGVDPQFGSGAGLVTWNHSGAMQARPLSMHVRQDGNELVVGTNYSPQNEPASIFTSLLDATGRSVQHYGSHGTCTYVWENGHGQLGQKVLGAGMLSDGKPILLTWNYNSSLGALVRLRMDGEVDSTFANDGLLDLGPTGGECVAVQTGDRIVVGGTDANSDFMMRRYTTDGQPDATFGTGGVFSYATSGACYRLHELPDGRWLAVGRYPDALLLLSADGVPDASFGTNGHATDPFVTGYQYLNDAAMQPDGRILVCSDDKIRRLLADGASLQQNFSFNMNSVGSPQLFAASDGSWYFYNYGLAKMTAGDTGDNTFGTAGLLSPANGVSTFHIDEGVRISLVGPAVGPEADNGCLARYTPEGQPDPDWGAEGQAYFTGSDAWAREGTSSFDASGRIVVLGTPWNGDGCLARLHIDGQMDETFSYDGLIGLANSNAAVCVTAQSTDQLVVAGFTVQGNGANAHVERFEDNGDDDPTYFQWLPFNSGLNQQRPADAVTMPDDQVAVLANISDINSSDVQTTGVAMLQTDGTVNSAFGTNGVFEQVQQGYQYGGSITLDLDGNLLCAVAEEDDPGELGITFYKLDPNGALLTSFGVGGFQHVDLPPTVYGLDIKCKPTFIADGRFYLDFHVAGGDLYGGHVARFLADGQLDVTFGGGLVDIAPNSSVGTLGLLSDGSILCASVDEVSQDLYVQKFLPTGDPDNTFGIDGTLTISDTTRIRFSTANVLVGANDEVFVSGILAYTSGWNATNFDPFLFHIAPDFNVSAQGPLNKNGGDGIVVFPSPVIDEFTVRLSASPAAKAVAYDATGRSTPLELVRRTADAMTFRFSGQPAAGMCVLVVSDQGRSTSARIVVADR